MKFSALEVLELDATSVVDIKATFSMSFTMPFLEKDYSAVSEIILQSYSTNERELIVCINVYLDAKIIVVLNLCTELFIASV